MIGQGFTDNSGRLDIYGAGPGDTVRASSFDGGLGGSAPVGADSSISLHLARIGGRALQAVSAIPHLHVIASPAPPTAPGGPQMIDLLVSLQGFGPGADPSIVITAPGSEQGYAPTLSYSPTTGAYEGRISFSAIERGTGRIQIFGRANGDIVTMQTTYRLQRVLNTQGAAVYSNNGNLELRLEARTLPGSDTYVVVMPPGDWTKPVSTTFLPLAQKR